MFHNRWRKGLRCPRAPHPVVVVVVVGCVQDQGFSWTPEPVNNSFHLVSVGATVQNPTDMIAYHTTLTITLLDGAGKSLTYKSFPHSTSLVIPVILPGQRVDFGDELIPEVGGFIFGSHNEVLEPSIKQKYGDAGPVASVRIGLSSTHWLSRDALGTDFASATAKVTVFDVQYRSVHYEVHAAGCGKSAPGHSVVVYRNGAGAVVGGATGTGSGSCATAEPSTYETYLVTNAPPPAGAVPDRSEVSLHCDVGQPKTP